MSKNRVDSNKKNIIIFIFFIILFLLFQNLIETIFVHLVTFISYNTVGFKIAYVLVFILLSVYYAKKIEDKYLPNPNLSLTILLILCCYVIFRISNNTIVLAPKTEPLKYLDIILIVAHVFCLLHPFYNLLLQLHF